jgi:hypothetical protein
MSDATLSLFPDAPGWLINPGTDLERRFARWAKDNPDVLAEFERRAIRLHESGQRRIGVKQIAEVIRYYAAVESRGDRFKVNNSYTSLLARWLIHRHPELADAIETRRRVA